MQESVKQDRDKYIGGSDIPVIMNLSPYKSRYDLLLEKAGVKEDTFTGNIYTEYGNKLEEKIRAYINEDLPEEKKYKEGKLVQEARNEDPIGLRLHTDGENETSILEIKTTGTIHENVTDYPIYLSQILFYMMNEEKDFGILAVYERPEDMSEDFDNLRLHLYEVRIEEHLEFCQKIAKAVLDFVEDLKKVKENPFIEESELLPAEIPDITDRIIAFEYQLDLMKDIEKKLKEEKAKLKKAMEVSGVKSWKTPNGYKVTLVEDGEDTVKEVTTFDEKKLQEDHPKIYKQYLTTEKKVVKGRAGYVKITAPKKEVNR
jgi:predicted phage-related endonuclease